MRDNDRDDLLVDVADAVTLNQRVEWDRCARLAAPAERRVLDNLCVLAQVFAGGHAAGDREVTAAATTEASYAGVFVRRVLTVLVAVAALEIVAALLLLPWMWADYHRVHGDVAVYMGVVLAGHGASAALLLLAGRHDRRTWLLGGYFLFRATFAPLHMLPAFLGHMPPADTLPESVWDMPVPTALFLLFCGFPAAFAIPPAFLWAFARECPRVHRRTWLDDLARRMVPVSVAITCAMCAGLAAVYVAGLVHDAVSGALLVAVLDATIVTANALSLAAVVVVVLRAHTAPADEVRRVVTFGLGMLAWMGMATAYDFVEAFSPGFWLSNYEPGSVLGLMQWMRFPGMVLLWYSVLAARVPHPREAVGAFYRRLLMRPGLLGAVAAVPAAALGWAVVSSLERPVGAFLADPLAQSLAAATGVLLLVFAGRERLLVHLDAWVYPEALDQRRALAGATPELAQAAGIETISETVTRTVERGCGAPASLLVALDSGTQAPRFSAPDAAVAPLARASAIVHLFETVGGSIRVRPNDAASVFELLPPGEARWVAETDADTVLPVLGSSAEVVGVLVVGRRFDGRIMRSMDLPFLEALAAAAGLAIARLLLLGAAGAGAPDAQPAHECPVCGYLKAAGDPVECECGSEYVETAIPTLLAGKYRLTRRLGSGGMGRVYLARDILLGRDVAVKTLPLGTGSRLMALRSEAWAMAAVAHVALAQIHAVETWRGRPFLVGEFLSGGTLADRLGSGSVPEAQAVRITVALAEGLAALHEDGYLHGDVKPSNIGFTSNGSPKLLDFGLARETEAALVGGTLRYLSAEVLSGRRPEAADDVWSLCVVLYEMVTGRHPFAGGGPDEVTDRIRRRLVADRIGPVSDSEPRSAAAGFAASVLAAPPSARPATAREFGEALEKACGDG